VEQECTDLKQESVAAGDQHYRAMTSWLTRGRKKELWVRARAFASNYRKKLRWLIECYRHLRPTARVQEKLHDAVEFQTLLEKDIKILDERRGDA